MGIFLVAVSACEMFTGPGRPDMSLTMNTAFVWPGSSVWLSVLNQSNRTWYGSTGCNFGIERQVDGVWTSVYGFVCLSTESYTGPGELEYVATEIEPLETEQFFWSIPDDAVLGVHRIRLRLTERVDGGGDVYHFISPPFTVTDGPIDFLRH
jgi:hypothetical protein